jgi:hypothetical protein
MDFPNYLENKLTRDQVVTFLKTVMDRGFSVLEKNQESFFIRIDEVREIEIHGGSEGIWHIGLWGSSGGRRATVARCKSFRELERGINETLARYVDSLESPPKQVLLEKEAPASNFAKLNSMLQGVTIE